MTKIQKILFLTVAAVFFSACVPEETGLPLPAHTIDPVSFNSEFAQYAGLRIIPSAVKIRNAGYNGNGIILVRIASDRCYAYAATCTKNSSVETSPLNLIDNYTARCPKCGAEYHIQLIAAPEKDGHTRLYDYRVYLHSHNPVTNDVRGEIRN